MRLLFFASIILALPNRRIIIGPLWNGKSLRRLKIVQSRIETWRRTPDHNIEGIFVNELGKLVFEICGVCQSMFNDNSRHEKDQQHQRYILIQTHFPNIKCVQSYDFAGWRHVQATLFTL